MEHTGWENFDVASLGAHDLTSAMGCIGYDGTSIHGWVVVQGHDGRSAQGYSSVKLDDVENAMMRSIGPERAEAGFFGIGKALKRAVRKIGKIKVINKAVNFARKAMKNPYIRAGLMAVPGGGTALAAHQAYEMARRAMSGNPVARKFLGNQLRSMRRGNPAALRFGGLLRGGIQAYGGRMAKRYLGAAQRYTGRRFARTRCAGDEIVGPQGTVPRVRGVGDQGVGVPEFGQYQIDGYEIAGHFEIAGEHYEIATMIPADVPPLVAAISSGDLPSVLFRVTAEAGQEPRTAADTLEDVRSLESWTKYGKPTGHEADAGDDVEWDTVMGAWEIAGAEIIWGDGAESGAAWDGARWAMRQLAPHSLEDPRTSARELLLLGQREGAARFA